MVEGPDMHPKVDNHKPQYHLQAGESVPKDLHRGVRIHTVHWSTLYACPLFIADHSA